MWEGWEAGFMAFHAFHTLSFPWPALLYGSQLTTTKCSKRAGLCYSPSNCERIGPLDDESTGALIAVVAERRANAALRSSWRLSDRISKHGDETEALVHWLAT